MSLNLKKLHISYLSYFLFLVCLNFFVLQQSKFWKITCLGLRYKVHEENILCIEWFILCKQTLYQFHINEIFEPRANINAKEYFVIRITNISLSRYWQKVSSKTKKSSENRKYWVKQCDIHYWYFRHKRKVLTILKISNLLLFLRWHLTELVHTSICLRLKITDLLHLKKIQ